MTISRRRMLVLPPAAALTAPAVTRARDDGAGVLTAGNVAWDTASLIIGGERVYLWSGEFHYWRLPSPDLWRDVLQKLRAAGFNATSIYFHWGFHSFAPGRYDFTGVRDVDRLLRIAREVGIRVLARPGPYINAETDSGGLPGWLLTQSGAARSDAPDYLASCREWYAAINAILSRHQITDGGPIILYQIENEYSFPSADKLHTDPPAEAIAYMEALEAAARADGIVVPLFHNDKGRYDAWRPGLPGGVDIYGFDCYPANISGTDYEKWSAIPDFAFERTLGAIASPLFIAEAGGGWFDEWGGQGFASVYAHVSPQFQRCYSRYNAAAGLTMQNFYMLFGGTSWGWLPFDGGYTSYDYGAAITEGRVLTAKYAEDKKFGYFVAAVAPLRDTNQLPDTTATTSAVRVRTMANQTTGTVFYTLIHSDTTSTADTSFTFPLTTVDGSYPVVPQQGTFRLNGHDAKLLVAGYDLERQRLVYSTSEIMTHAPVGAADVVVLYGRAGEGSETVLRYGSAPAARVLQGAASFTWDPTRNDFRVNAVHDGLTIVAIEGGGRAPLSLLIADDDTAATFWRLDTPHRTVLVRGPALLRSARAVGPVLLLEGDTLAPSPLEVVTDPPVSAVVWNNARVAVQPTLQGSLFGALPGPLAVTLPPLGNWRIHDEAPERAPDFDDDAWLAADRTTTTNPLQPPAGQPVLYADDYGFHHGDVWYRGRFTATGTETGLTLANNDGLYGGFVVWLNGTAIGGGTKPGTETLAFPSGLVVANAVNVLAVLCENLGHAEDGGSNDAQKAPRGLLSASLAGSEAALSWKIQGALGGETPVDPVRGAFNNGGLYGERAGWHLPGYPDRGWATVSLPATQSAVGVAWYRTEFTLDVPDGHDASLALAITDTPARNWRARLFVNGWHMGIYINELGPQTVFPIPDGILHPRGRNTLAVAVFSDGTGGLGSLALVALQVAAGGVRVARVTAPDYDPAIWTG